MITILISINIFTLACLSLLYTVCRGEARKARRQMEQDANSIAFLQEALKQARRDNV